MKKNLTAIILIILSFTFYSCKSGPGKKSNNVIVGIPSDVESFNPLYAFSVDEGNISDLLYLGLVQFDWNSQKGDLKAEPMLAKKWEWASDSSYIIFYLRDDVNWTDGVKFNAEDVVFSFDVYSDPDADSRLYGSFKDFYVDSSDHIDIKKSFEIINPYELKIKFPPQSFPKLYELVFPLIPKHIFEKINRKNLFTSNENFNPVGNGPFMLQKWDKNQSIILKQNINSFLYNEDGVSKLIFKVVPDYYSRITQLKKGEIDIMELIKPDDVSDLKKNSDLTLIPIKGREYDYIGWNNIDPDVYNKSKKIVPNKLFGSAKVRRALTYAINRKEIVSEFLHGYGQLSVGPVSPIFSQSVDSSLKPFDYNVEKAKELLSENGWKDKDNDGILEKGNTKFKFTLYIPGGNPRRNYASTVVKNNLKAVGIDMDVQTLELGVLIDKMNAKSLNAWMIGWFTPIPIDLKVSWYSDIERTPFNFVSYQNKKADEILVEVENRNSLKTINKLYREFQKLIHNDEPVTFLYWIDNLTAYNNKIKNIHITPLGVVHHCWDWTISE